MRFVVNATAAWSFPRAWWLFLAWIVTGVCVCSAQQMPPQGAARPAIPAGLGYYANAHPYLEEPVKRLIKHIPELSSLRAASNQELLPIILMHAGMRTKEFFDDVVDLAAREQVSQQILTLKGAPIEGRQVQYDYLILVNRREAPPRYEEYRADGEGKRADQDGLEEGYAITAGFALKCIYFLPAMHEDSTFRYLGDEMFGLRDTYVVAFAQRPTQTGFWGTVTGAWGTVRILDQGIAWIDKNTFQILRLRTDLLAAHSEIGLARQTTEIVFAAVEIPDVAKPLWLPNEVRVDADFQGHTFRNEHHYSDYRRFRVSVKMGLPETEETPDHQ